MTTRELAATCNVSERQLQWWDEHGVLTARIDGWKREYSDEDVVKCWAIARLLRKGLTLPQIRKLLPKLPAAGYALVAVGPGRRVKLTLCPTGEEAMRAASDADSPVVLIEIVKPLPVVPKRRLVQSPRRGPNLAGQPTAEEREMTQQALRGSL